MLWKKWEYHVIIKYLLECVGRNGLMMLRVSVGVFFLVKVILVEKLGGQHAKLTPQKVVCHFCGLLHSILFVSCLSFSRQPQNPACPQMQNIGFMLFVLMVQLKAEIWLKYIGKPKSISYKDDMQWCLFQHHLSKQVYNTLFLRVPTRNGMVWMEK